MKLIDTNLLKTFWQTVKNYTGELQCVSRQAKEDTEGNPISEYYLPKANVVSKGNKNKPVYFDANGVAKPVERLDTSNIVADKLGNADVGDNTTFMYLKSGVATKSTADVGNNTQFIYMQNGKLNASNANIGTSGNPVYIKNGTITACNIFPKQLILDIVFPVGTIHISVTSTNPSTLWGGEWKQIGGRFLLGVGNNEANTNNAYGTLSAQTINRGVKEMGGEIQHTLITDETPKHSHGKGKMKIVGKILCIDTNESLTYADKFTNTGALYMGDHFSDAPNAYVKAEKGGTYQSINLDTSKKDEAWTGNTSEVGKDKPHNNMPPYYAVYIWERIK